MFLLRRVCPAPSASPASTQLSYPAQRLSSPPANTADALRGKVQAVKPAGWFLTGRKNGGARLAIVEVDGRGGLAKINVRDGPAETASRPCAAPGVRGPVGARRVRPGTRR